LAALNCPPVVLETHAGFGRIYGRCYSHVETGVALELSNERCEKLAATRPSWAVYQVEAEAALKAGAGRHLEINFVDFDPYGDPWPYIDAFLTSDRPKPSKLVLVVNDGMRQALRIDGGYRWNSLGYMTARFGHLYRPYLDVVRVAMTEKAEAVGYKVKRWAAYNTGHMDLMTHYAAVLER
jgi:hypothetical protein